MSLKQKLYIEQFLTLMNKLLSNFWSKIKKNKIEFSFPFTDDLKNNVLFTLEISLKTE